MCSSVKRLTKPKDYKMKNVLITGASKGLGLEIVKEFLRHKWQIYCISRTVTEELEKMLIDHSTLHHKKVDLQDPTSLQKEIFQTFIPNSIPLDAIVHNAAIAYDDIITNVKYKKVEAMYGVNVFSPMMINKYGIRNMLFNRRLGNIVSVSSISTTTGYKGLSMYASTKGALEAHSKNLAREWGPKGIKFNCVVPGFMETSMSQKLTSEQKSRIYNRTSLKKPTSMKSVAETIFFLCSDGAASITGQNFYVDCGTV